MGTKFRTLKNKVNKFDSGSSVNRLKSKINKSQILDYTWEELKLLYLIKLTLPKII